MAKSHQLHLPGLDAPARPPVTDARARPRKGVELVRVSRWSPRFVWTLHRVPGRLDGPPLAVRRRVLRDGDGLVVETPEGSVYVSNEDLAAVEHGGRARSDGPWRYSSDRYELAFDVFDHCPTAEERDAWLERRRRLSALLRSPPTHAYAVERTTDLGIYRVTREQIRRAWIHLRGDCSDRFALEHRAPREGWAHEMRPADLRDLAESGRAQIGNDGLTWLYLDVPSVEALFALEERAAEQKRQSDRTDVGAKAFAAFIRQGPIAPAEDQQRDVMIADARFTVDVHAARLAHAEELERRIGSRRRGKGAETALAGAMAHRLRAWLDEHKDEERAARRLLQQLEARKPGASDRDAPRDREKAQEELLAWSRYVVETVEGYDRRIAAEVDKAAAARAAGDCLGAYVPEWMADYYRSARQRFVGDGTMYERARQVIAPGTGALEGLGLGPEATAEEVRAAFREKAKTGHPDQGGTLDMGQLVALRDAALSHVAWRDTAPGRSP